MNLDSRDENADVGCWHEAAVLCVPANDCSCGKSGRAADITAMTDFDPTVDIIGATFPREQAVVCYLVKSGARARQCALISEQFRFGKGLVGHAVASWLRGAIQSLS